MQFYFVLLLVAAASATPVNPNLLKHLPNNAPVLNLNHKNVHLTHQVPVQVAAPAFYHNQVVPQQVVYNQVVPQVYTHALKKQVVSQVVPQVYTHGQVVPQVYTHGQVVPQVYTHGQVVPQVYTHGQVVPQVYTHGQVVPQVYTVVNKPVVPQVYSVVQTPAQLTPGYVAANHGAVHTAPLPEGPSGDGFYASHHINLPNVKA